MINYIKIINHWYISKCDGIWEHEYGFTLKTIDNPGWWLEINGENNKNIIEIKIDEDNEDWLFINANNDKFQASCSNNNLKAMLEYAIDWLNIKY